MRTALIPGTYDPVTLGHRDVIVRAAQIFDSVVVAVAASPKKGAGPLFTLAERVSFVEDAVSDLPNVRVRPFTSLLVDFAVEVGASAIVKGLRAMTDFESEFQQASLNYRLNPELETLFIMASPEHMYLSSSAIREIASMRGNVHPWVTPRVEAALVGHFSS
ncbi:MAG: pantetheine-phosphate adenylyltransferase [Coriobacteriales bacterium]|jgi:pantetheine-phosphate adenylyltransferase|nr:pantetheine-phosphate adenylyltransferase [Coriobacteriales bacterium]